MLVDIKPGEDCETKKYCSNFLERWYPHKSIEELTKECPLCCHNCNCKMCLRVDYKIKHGSLEVSDDEKVHRSKYLIRMLLPHLKEINEEQVVKRKVEAEITATIRFLPRNSKVQESKQTVFLMGLLQLRCSSMGRVKRQ